MTDVANHVVGIVMGIVTIVVSVVALLARERISAYAFEKKNSPLAILDA